MTIRPLAFINHLFHQQGADVVDVGSSAAALLHARLEPTATSHQTRDFRRGLEAVRDLPGGAVLLDALNAHGRASGAPPRIVLATDRMEPGPAQVSNGTWRVDPRALREHPRQGLRALAQLYEDLAQPRLGRFHGVAPELLPQPDAELQRTWQRWIQQGVGPGRRLEAVHAMWNWHTETAYYGGVNHRQMLCLLDCIALGQPVPAQLYAELDLSGLSLRELPEMPPNVHCLRADDNSLTTLAHLPDTLRILRLNRAFMPFGHPAVSRQLLRLPARLVELELDGNQLSTRLQLTGIERWRLPRHLKLLSLSRNGLRTLPALPGELATLRAACNCLMDIRSLGEAHRLREADFSHNALDFIPPAILRLPRSCRVDLTGNPLLIVAHRIAERENLALRLACWRLADEVGRMGGPRMTYESAPGPGANGRPAAGRIDPAGPDLQPDAGYMDESQPPGAASPRLEDEVRFWIGEERMKGVAPLWHDIAAKDGADAFALVLHKLRNESKSMEDAGFRESMAVYLMEFIRPERAELQAITLATCEERRGRCVDRAAVVMVQLKILLANDDAARGAYDEDPAGLAKLGEQLFILDLLTKEAIAKAEVIFKHVHRDLQEHVEVVLACYVRFREKLGLSLVVPRMNFQAASRLKEKDYREIEAAINEKRGEEFPYFMNVEWEGWQHMLKRKFPREYSAAQERCYQELEYMERDITLALRRQGLDFSNQDLRTQAGVAALREMRYRNMAPVTRACLESMGEHALASLVAPNRRPAGELATNRGGFIGPA